MLGSCDKNREKWCPDPSIRDGGSNEMHSVNKQSMQSGKSVSLIRGSNQLRKIEFMEVGKREQAHNTEAQKEIDEPPERVKRIWIGTSCRCFESLPS